MLTHAVDVVVFAVAVDTRDKQTTSQFPDFRFGLALSIIFTGPIQGEFPFVGVLFSREVLDSHTWCLQNGVGQTLPMSL